ncbi:MFS transporter [Nonomuraea sp. 3-1Str]|uniref:MFS transporter n=1 Tax=Nonomuraea sp. 3-1Str TaxID=2929801 RepID=UPI002854ECB0|nr:MFS transporter [Nonomuraea sp. 3-1Str]MDR8409721.1 MFS transporter [Nonomuraea sp. 3-1Str]
MIAVTPRLLGRLGAKPLIVLGLLVLAAGVGALSLVRPDGAFAVDVLPDWLVAAVGMSLAYIPAMMAAMSGVRPEESGPASGIVNTTYNVGSALGLAVMTAVATSQGAAELGNLPRLTDGFQAAFVGAPVVAVAGGLLVLVLMRRPKPAVVADVQPDAQPDAQPLKS